ncbi:unnamed protein product [Arabidopsis thaliana]|uniref:(thale cress) hypothetical protein n=1 Tax=Arabidopsis thaliana TaxID=3702 RepID=A0A7G2EAS8_ARATH|nr:unnamed protein product [Arabidopsis thaliana]
MGKLQHGSHECELTSPEIIANGICNMCFKDEPVEFACNPCNFDLCKACSDLPLKMSHHLHPEHPLEFRIGEVDRKTKYMVCVGCGNMSSGTYYYECSKCEIYLDLGCALQKSITTGWEAKEMLHYSHEHQLKRCRPGPDSRGSCLLCEQPLSFTSTCYGCVHCYLFFHEHCLDLPTEIQHPVHPMHPLKRLDYIQTFDDALLRGLMHKSHEHRLFYVEDSPQTRNASGKRSCIICESVVDDIFYYLCVQCGLECHTECLELPEYLVKKSYHVHPLRYKRVGAEDDFLEYCGVCETMVLSGNYAYCCEECDFLGHTECILREEVPSPLYLKDLYSCKKENTKSKSLRDLETSESQDRLLVNDFNHIHVMSLIHMSELKGKGECNMCELGRPSRHQFHLNHSLTLLPDAPRYKEIRCGSCKLYIEGFNLFCRICCFIIDINCALEDKKMHGALQMGQKIIGTWLGLCIQDKHSLFQVIVSRSYPIACSICDEKLCGIALSCVTCGDICHPMCIQVGRRVLVGHPLHSDHMLAISHGICLFKCTACQLKITTNVCTRPCDASFYGCIECMFSAHEECIGFPANVKNQQHHHTLTQVYNSRREKWSFSDTHMDSTSYACYHCDKSFNNGTIMFELEREEATEEEQLQDIYLMYLERVLLDVLRIE